jgi:hypothetical protein
MKKTSLLLAVLVSALAAGGQPQPDLIARIHFAGADRIAADPSHVAFTNEFCSAEARALASQTLDKLARTPGDWFKSRIPPGAGDGAAQLRPLLDDFLKSEWIFEMREAPGSPEYALAIRLGPERAQLWSKNLAALLQGWTGVGVSQDKSGNWTVKKHEPPDLFQFSRSGDWVIIDCGQDKLTLSSTMLPSATASDGWLSVEANWPRLAQLFPALKAFDLPKLQMQAVGRGTNLQLTGNFTLAQPLAPLGKWQVPTGAIHQPLVSFTAARGVGPWLARQGWLRPLAIQPPPDQVFIWAQARIPFQTFAAAPVPDAKVALAQLDQRLSADPSWQEQFFNRVALEMTNNEISLRGLPPLIMPFVQALQDPAGDFLVGGLVGGVFPRPPRALPPPPEVLAALNRPNLVYYDWEITAERLNSLPPQMMQMLLLVTRHEQLKMNSAAGKWFVRIGPTLGSTVTEVTQTAPNQLAFKRTAPGGLTAIELLALVDWLEAPGFPALHLRLPPPRLRPGQRPAGLPMAPPVVPAPTHP